MATANNATLKQLGAFYTPLDIATLLAQWALKSPSDTIFDPSYGGCAFLYAAQNVLRQLGCKLPGKQIYGVDIDVEAEKYLAQLINDGAQPSQYLRKSFFKTHPSDFNDHQFDCILGNPPYINYHNIERSERDAAWARAKELGFKISGRASTWAFFVLHSLQFLKPGGRFAMVLPNSFIHADYSQEVKSILEKRFEHLNIILLTERIFDDTEEQVALVLGDNYGYREKNAGFSIYKVNSASELSLIFGNINASSSNNATNINQHIVSSLLGKDVLTVLDEISRSTAVISLGDWVNIRIGVVTGSNKHFTLLRSNAATLGISDRYLKPIITKPAQLQRICLENDELEQLIKQDGRNLLLALPQDMDIDKDVSKYLETIPLEVQNATKCRERKPWYSVRHTFAPHAFLQYMSAKWPRIVINRTNATCTNNIHRLCWNSQRIEQDWLRLAVSSLSTYWQLNTELYGRSYGGGVLKVEPKEALQLNIALIDCVDENFLNEINTLLGIGDFEGVTDIVDEKLLVQQLGLSKIDVELLRNARDYLFERRRGHRATDAKR